MDGEIYVDRKGKKYKIICSAIEFSYENYLIETE